MFTKLPVVGAKKIYKEAIMVFKPVSGLPLIVCGLMFGRNDKPKAFIEVGF